jgi:hypothetical protein
MTTVLLVGAAIFLLGGKGLAQKIASWWLKVPQFSAQQMIAAVLLAAAAVSIFWQAPRQPPQPTPPQPQPALVLDGLFTGPTAAEDASIVSAMTAELADEIAWDGTREQEKRILVTGVAIDELRRRMRELRCRGESIGQRQPMARDAIAKHLDEAVGNSGGPIDEAKRAAWVKALGEISEAAADVTR